jgi:hypothetical protein
MDVCGWRDHFSFFPATSLSQKLGHGMRSMSPMGSKLPKKMFNESHQIGSGKNYFIFNSEKGSVDIPVTVRRSDQCAEARWRLANSTAHD